MAIALDDECRRAELDPRKVEAIARRLERAAADARRLGLTVFGGSGLGSLRWHDPISNDVRQGPLVVAHMRGDNFDGGDGAEHQDDFGLTRGENAS